MASLKYCFKKGVATKEQTILKTNKKNHRQNAIGFCFVFIRLQQFLKEK